MPLIGFVGEARAIQEATGLVSGIEAGVEQRVERQHQRAVIAPGARRLVVDAVAAPIDGLDVARELVRHAERIADQVAVDGSGDAISHRASGRTTAGRCRTRRTRSRATPDR